MLATQPLTGQARKRSLPCANRRASAAYQIPNACVPELSGRFFMQPNSSYLPEVGNYPCIPVGGTNGPTRLQNHRMGQASHGSKSCLKWVKPQMKDHSISMLPFAGMMTSLEVATRIPHGRKTPSWFFMAQATLMPPRLMQCCRKSCISFFSGTKDKLL